MGISERKEREKAEMRKNILDAAIQLFVEEGYESVSIRKIAEKIEYSPATIYTYFEDRADILFELHNIGFTMFFEKQMSIQNITDPKERLAAHGREYIQFAVEYPQYYDIMFIMRLPGEKISKYECWDMGERSYNILQENVKQCKEAGYFKESNIEAVSFLMWSSVHGIASLYIRQRLAFVSTTSEFLNDFVNNSVHLLKTLIR